LWSSEVSFEPGRLHLNRLYGQLTKTKREYAQSYAFNVAQQRHLKAKINKHQSHHEFPFMLEDN
jgi:hypothetical protein